MKTYLVNFRILTLSRALLATVSMAALAATSRAQISIVNGVTVDSALPAPTPSISLNVQTSTFPFSFFNSTTFGTIDPTGSPASATVTGGVVDGVLDPSVTVSSSTTGFANTVFDTASLGFSFIVVPAGGLNSSNTGQSVTIDITGSASISAGGSFYDSAYSPSATASISGPGLSGSDPIVNLGHLASTGTVTDNNFDLSYTLIAGDIYTVSMQAFVGESADPGEILSATIDPQMFIDPTFSLSNPGYSLAFSPGFPGTAIPEPSAYATILGAAALGFVVIRRRTQRRLP